MKITLVSAGTAVYGVLRIDGQHHSLAVGDTLTIDEPKPPPPPDPRFTRGGRYATITPTEIRHHDIPEGLHVQWPYSLDADAPQSAEAILGHEPLAALDAERFAVTPHLREHWTKGPGSTTPRWPEQDRSTTMYADRETRDFDPTEPMAEDFLGPLDAAVAELDDAMERLERTLAPMLRDQGMTLATEAITADKVGPDNRSEVRKRVAANAARLNRMTTTARDLRERIDL